MFQIEVRIGENVALKFSDIEYGKIAIQRMEEKVFVFDGERLTARAVTYWISKYCRDAGFTYKSPHCTRRNTASRLSNAGMTLCADRSGAETFEPATPRSVFAS